MWEASNRGRSKPSKSASPGSIKKYMTQDGDKDSPANSWGAKSKISEASQKNFLRRQPGDTDTSLYTHDEIVDEPVTEARQKKELPTKGEMAEMFARLELSIKGEVATLHEDLNQILKRVEETEENLDFQAAEKKELKEQMEEIQSEQRYTK